MGLTTAYLTSTKDLEEFFNALVTVQAPEQFSISFLQKLDFKSSSHRLFIAVLKGLGFLTADGGPTQRYYDFLDQTRSKVVLADAIRDAYGDLFAINRNAFEMESDEVKNKLRTLTQGKKTEDVLAKMAATFVALCRIADWTSPPTPPRTASEEVTPAPDHVPIQPVASADPGVQHQHRPLRAAGIPSGLHYNIQIHLPESRDMAVYDAIFRALREHLF